MNYAIMMYIGLVKKELAEQVGFDMYYYMCSEVGKAMTVNTEDNVITMYSLQALQANLN